MNSLYDVLNLKDRLREIFIGSEIILFLVLIGNYYTGQDDVIVGLLLLTFFLNIAPIIALALDKVALANNLFLAIMCVFVTAVIWFNGGLKDTGLLVYPALLVYTAILGNSRQFYVVTIFLVLSSMALGMAHLLELKSFSEPKVLLIDLIDIPLIFLIIAFSVRAVFDNIDTFFQREATDPDSLKALDNYTDRLTNLPGQLIAEDFYQRAVLLKRSSDSKVTLLSIDLDEFASVNISLGMDVGDSLITETAKRLSSLLNNRDFIFRISGDEFVVILRSKKQSEALAAEINQHISAPFTVGPHKINITASIGIFRVVDPGISFSEACTFAQTAMIQVKSKGGNGYQLVE